MRVAILGSGFGLYGYLPAIAVGCRQHVVLPERYRERMRLRADVGDLTDSVEWAASDDAMLERAEALVISQRPADQVDRVRDCLCRQSIAGLILEKPLAPDPAQAIRLLEEIEGSRKRFCIGYVFRYTEWGGTLLSLARNLTGNIHIDWYFRAHHYAVGAKNWKRRMSTGGGALRFYGIQLIALLAEVGYNQTVSSCIGAEAPDEAETWRAVITGTGLPECHINVDTNSADKLFRVGMEHAPGGKRLSFMLLDPFDTAEAEGRFDARVAMLTEHCQSFFQKRSTTGDSYARSITLWHEIEAKTRLERRPSRSVSGPASSS
jgi:hypothetical protein